MSQSYTLFGSFGARGHFFKRFWRPLDFEGGPKIDQFLRKSKKKEKKEVQETRRETKWFQNESSKGKGERLAPDVLQNSNVRGVMKY